MQDKMNILTIQEWKRMLAQSCSLFAQYLQDNYRKMAEREDYPATMLMLNEGLKEGAKICYLMNRQLIPHDERLYSETKDLEFGNCFVEYAERILRIANAIEYHHVTEEQLQPVLSEIAQLALYLKAEMQDARMLSDSAYAFKGIHLEDASRELTESADISEMSEVQLVENIVRLEWRAFDKVINEGGRASCQDDWETFSVMRKSQYQTWPKHLLVKYLQEFIMASNKGWNLITEKYGRMEEYTTPERWAKLKNSFPEIPQERKEIIDAIVAIQVAAMENFAKEYPKMAGNARSIHSDEDNAFNTSYETYLRGEISTYSEGMLIEYGMFVAALISEGKNPAYLVMEQTAHLYGYVSVEDVERKME